MTEAERQAFRDEALDPARQAALRASSDAVGAWEALHPVPFEECVAFSTELHELFGPFERASGRVDAGKLRL